MAVLSGGTGEKLGHASIIVAGVAALVASFLSFVSMWLQTVPIYSLSSWSSIISLKVAMFVDPVRDIYEAFTIYTFFQLLINFIGGERSLIILMHGREPVHHLWPLNHFLPKVDISDPHTFLALKRGILQYTWLKPILGLAAIIMKSTGTYKEGYLGVDSGYLWSGILYNVSVTVSLYSLGMFWVCMSKDLQPFRPVPKFLCIKLIIFASYWQGFFLSILVWLGAVPDTVDGYTPDNLAAAIQDTLICIEMPLFAIGHWYAFSWHDYADSTVSAARLPVWYAVRDAFGIRDLIEDTKETFRGDKYEYRLFDSGDNVLAHEESSSRVARMMEGMRYERGGKGKYWLPKPGEANARTPLLSRNSQSNKSGISPMKLNQQQDPEYMSYGNVDDEGLDPEEESLYERARDLVHGDWNYPVITANIASRERWLNAQPDLLTTSANRNLLQPTRDNKIRRESNIRETVEEVTKNTKRKHRKDSSEWPDVSRQNSRQNSKGKQKATQESEDANGEEGRAPIMSGLLRHHSSGSRSNKSDRSQLVDLVVEDTGAEDAEKVRARKEGGSAWNTDEQKRYVRTYGKDTGEDIREGYEPTDEVAVEDPKEDASSYKFVVANNNEEEESEESWQWKQAQEPKVLLKPKYGVSEEAFDNVWSRGESAGPPSENP
ncbi:organic solute transporter Ostalpha-domain-containing protein [Calycina marina]|uniref:Organic solute transporter Ostalpha-domain-containing protein n=1 Tax=Calycina marina TaxID=1763456 RepID=A0A9P8CCN2_9HELO|nr:organic solute transporter Ostalpha-domain-containing protein [Calycina marina]